MCLHGLLFLASLAAADAQIAAAISGQVKDPSGAVIRDATVAVKSLESGATRVSTTDADGSFRFLSLPLGQQEVKVEKTGFKAAIRTGVNLEVGQEAVVALSPKGNAITYLPSAKTVSPAITLGAESKTAAYNVTVAAVGAPKGSSLTFVKEPKQQLMWFGDDTKAKRTYTVKIQRYTSKASRVFGRQVTISGNQQAFLYYGPLGKPNGHAKIVVYTPGHRNHPVKELPVEVIG